MKMKNWLKVGVLSTSVLVACVANTATAASVNMGGSGCVIDSNMTAAGSDWTSLLSLTGSFAEKDWGIVPDKSVLVHEETVALASNIDDLIQSNCADNTLLKLHADANTAIVTTGNGVATSKTGLEIMFDGSAFTNDDTIKLGDLRDTNKEITLKLTVKPTLTGDALVGDFTYKQDVTFTLTMDTAVTAP